MDYVSGSRARTLLTTARALQQECRMLHCDIMPRCDKMPQLHRFSWTAIEYSIVHSEVRRISSESRRGSRTCGSRLCRRIRCVAWRLPDYGSKHPGAAWEVSA